MAILRDKFGSTLDEAHQDSFGRIRSTTPHTVFDDKHTYGINDGVQGIRSWIYTSSGTGTATYQGSSGVVRINTGTDSGDFSRKQSFRNISYTPGKSQLAIMTGVLGSGESGNVKRIGMFDSNNGVFFTCSSGQFGVVVRSDADGTVQETFTPQNSWNADVFDGNAGPRNESRINVDFTKSQIFHISYQWLGVGTVKFQLFLDGKLYTGHQANNSNKLTVPYMRTGSLPLAYEVHNNGTTVTSNFIDSICATGIVEGNELSGPSFLATNDGTLRTGITNREPILAVRLKNDFNGRQNKTTAKLKEVKFYAEDKNCYFELINATQASSIEATWLAVDSGSSGVEYSVDVASVHGASEHMVTGDYIAAGAAAKAGSIALNIESGRDPYHFLVQNTNSTDSQCFIVYATSLTTAAKAAAVIDWEELN